MRIDKECCPICYTEHYKVENYEVEDTPFDDDHIYKGWECICRNGHHFSMTETYKLISRECTSMEK